MSVLQAENSALPAGSGPRQIAAVIAASAALLLALAAPADAALRVSLLLAAPLTEELVFRAGLQEQLLRRNWGRWPAILSTAVIFSLLHGITRGSVIGLAVFAPACLLGWIYQLKRQVLLCIATHSALNLAWWLISGSSLFFLLHP